MATETITLTVGGEFVGRGEGEGGERGRRITEGEARRGKGGGCRERLVGRRKEKYILLKSM